MKVEMKPIGEMMTVTVKRIWNQEATKMVKELHERMTARILEMEQQLRVDYQRDVDKMVNTFYVVLPGDELIRPENERT